MRIGYVYPAGGQQGQTFEITLGGQFLEGADSVLISGAGVKTEIVNHLKPLGNREAFLLRDRLKELMDKKQASLFDPLPRKDEKDADPMKRDPMKMDPMKMDPSKIDPAKVDIAKILDPKRPAVKIKPPTYTNENGPPGRPGAGKNASDNKNAPAGSKKESSDENLEEKKVDHTPFTQEDQLEIDEIRRQLLTHVQRPSAPALQEQVLVKVTLGRDADPGPREIRLSANGKLSNPLVFCVGQIPEFSQIPARFASEPTRSVGIEETTVKLPVVLNGQIMPGGVDRYRFNAIRGQNLVLIASARSLIPYLPDAVPGWFQATLTLSDAQGKEVAYDDDFRFSPDPVLHYIIPASGEYVLEIKDSIYRGREDFVYRIAVGELPFITGIYPIGGPAGEKTTVDLKGWNLAQQRAVYDASSQSPGIYPLEGRKGMWVSNIVPFHVDSLPETLEAEPNNAAPQAQALSLPLILNGRIDKPGDVDLFSFTGQAGQTIVAQVLARRLNSPVDSALKLSDSTGKQIAWNDDYEDKGAGLTTHHADSSFTATLPADGQYFLLVSDVQHQGGPDFAYRLRLSAPEPSFDLRVVPASLAVRGGSAPVTVFALRRDGFKGEIKLAIPDAPPGVKLNPDRIPADQDQVKVNVSIPRKENRDPAPLHMEGKADINGKTVTRPAVPAEDMMQAFFYRHLVPAQDWIVSFGNGKREENKNRKDEPSPPSGKNTPAAKPKPAKGFTNDK